MEIKHLIKVVIKVVIKEASIKGLLAVALAGIIASCGQSGADAKGSGKGGADPASGNGKPTVVSTTGMVTDMVRRVGGDHVEVVGLMGPGVDPHLYKPTASDVIKLKGAQAIFYSGLMLEGRMADTFAKMGRSGAKVYAVTEDISQEKLLEPADFEGHWDPHVWGDPRLWAQTVEVVVRGLSEIDPSNAKAYASNGEDYRQEVLALYDWGLNRAGEVPEKSRKLVTSHDAYNYFGRAFGFEVVGVQGISTVSEAGLADVAKMVDYIKENGIKAIFVETSVAGANIERISEDSGVKIGGELYSDATGAAGHVEDIGGMKYDHSTYKGWLCHNVNTVVEALK